MLALISCKGLAALYGALKIDQLQDTIDRDDVGGAQVCMYQAGFMQMLHLGERRGSLISYWHIWA